MSHKDFQIMRFNILAAALNPGLMDKVPDDYAFAWYRGVYPSLHENECVKAFAEDFDVSPQMMTALLQKLDEQWDLGNGPGISFYDLERFFDVRSGGSDWDRSKLISAVTYIYLHSNVSQMFDQNLFDSLIQNAGAPTEATGFMRRFDRNSEIELF